MLWRNEALGREERQKTRESATQKVVCGKALGVIEFQESAGGRGDVLRCFHLICPQKPPRGLWNRDTLDAVPLCKGKGGTKES